MVELSIQIIRDDSVPPDLAFCASIEQTDSIIAGHGSNLYEALHDLINELEYHHEFFRAEDE